MVQVCILQQDKQPVVEDVFELLNIVNAYLCKLKGLWMVVEKNIIMYG